MMIAPDLMPNEHFMSAIGRWWYLSDRCRFSHLAKQLDYKCKSIRPQELSPKDENRVCALVNHSSICDMWNNHGYGYYVSAALSREEIGIFHQSAHSNNPTTIKIRGVQALSRNYWQWCEDCARGDAEELGITYYRRDHQIPGVLHCKVHNKGLLGECSHCGFQASRLRNLPIPPSAPICPRCGLSLQPYNGHFSDTMKLIERISISLCQVNNLSNTDLIKPIVDQTNLDFYPDNTLAKKKEICSFRKHLIKVIDHRALEVYFKPSALPSALPSIFRSPRLHHTSSIAAPIHPIAYLIAACYLNADLSDLITNLGA